MKLKNVFCHVLLTSLLLSQMACDKEEHPNVVDGITVPFAPHLKVFGFYNYPNGPGSIAEQAPYSTMVDIPVGLSKAELDWAISLLEATKANGLKAKANLYAASIWANGTPSAAQQKVWDDAVARLKPYQSTIGAFYTTDEPVWNDWKGASGGNPWSGDFNTLQATIDQTNQKLFRMNAAVKKAFPGVPSVLVEAWPILVWHMQGHIKWSVPTNYDWVGIDCYERLDGNHNNPGAVDNFDKCHGYSIPNFYQAIGAKLTGNQKMILIPPGHIQFARDSTEPYVDEVIQHTKRNMQKYLDFAVSNPRIIGMWPWMYSVNGNGIYHEGNTQYRGYMDLPAEAKKIYQDIGKAIKHQKR